MLRHFFAASLLLAVSSCTATAPAFAGSISCEASQYGVGDGYQGGKTASGERFNTFATSPYTVAMLHRPLFSYVDISANGRTIHARVTDRGPYHRGRCVDLGRAGANALGLGGTGRVTVSW